MTRRNPRRTRTLGAANDAPINVQIELAAARIAASGYAFDYGTLRSLSWSEGAGWDAADEDEISPTEPALCWKSGHPVRVPPRVGFDMHDEPVPERDWHAGWLAHEIVTHGSDQWLAHQAKSESTT